jgi:hypothetical protein
MLRLMYHCIATTFGNAIPSEHVVAAITKILLDFSHNLNQFGAEALISMALLIHDLKVVAISI